MSLHFPAQVPPVIAIDGPSASGKGTVALAVATSLGWHYLDSGAIYRVMALSAHQNNVDWQNEKALADLAQRLPVAFEKNRVWLNGEDVSEAIRREEIGMGASLIARFPLLRAALLQRQRDFLIPPGLVADGRDMASVVFPQARLKVFLTASSEVRARRRAMQLHIAVDSVAFGQILADIEKRDEADRNRAVAPLQPVDDARILDTSHLTISESVQKVLDWYQKI
ncbi:(d)CMP kinase [Neisseriaceae bacterium ESL0693]|nr:(d)CMP kinase [Neisseriaceae bacterium ESL0693]